MPNFDKTGPQGQGAKTGRGLGKCEGANNNSVRPCGRPCGRGRGMNRGFAQGVNLENKPE